ncbi:O-acyltransferase like protein-like [Pectinophora gossypiella]|uniref:O-acyltransferase like protein-like n=1 Tax=Pectinophora gossypiella TaxID=13191 RepID=UPI00214EF975|nr:O-acyltransferase like protein-like [Pectinophora gossypiella]
MLCYVCTDEQYYRMPQLFSLEDREACVRLRGDYCLGTFTLRPRTERGRELFDIMLKYSQDDRNFNHTVLHRGYCVTTRCPDLASRTSSASRPARRFLRCVDREAEAYGLRASPLRLDSCETAAGDPPPDVVDWSFAVVVAVIVVLNVAGTVYDFTRSPDEKPNQYLLPWSVRVNWRRLTATYDDGDPRLTALKSVQGVKAFTLALVMLGHSMIVHNMSYIENTRFFEQGNAHWLATFLHNGSVVVQGFVLVSAFLLAYNLLLLRDAGVQLRLRMLPAALLHRLIRIVPLHMFMVGLSATWWSRGGAGAQWALLHAQRAACRSVWWAHALSLNNILTVDDRCLLQAWFLAADMQVFVVTAAVTLWLAGRQRGGGGRGALRLLAALVAGAVAGNWLLAYWLQVKPIMLEMKPDVIREQYVGSASFKWMYAAPWGSLPAGLLGVWLAFLHHRLQRLRIRPERSKIFRLAYTWFLPALFLWVLGGHLVRHAPAPVVALYAAADRVGYVAIGATGLIGFFNGVDSFWKRFFEWRGWLPLGRMSLAVMLVHWNWHLTHIALKTTLSTVSVFEVGGHWHSVQIMSYVTALPLHLCLEVPAQRSLQALLFKTVKT